MKKTITVLLTTIIVFSGMIISAQPQSAKGKPMNQEFRMYYEKNIKPVLIEEQDKYMAVLSDDEKAELKQIRQDWKTVRENMQGTVAPADRENTQKTHFAAFNDRVAKIADAHPKMKEEYIKEMTPKKEQWKKDMKSIREKNNLPANDNKPFLERVDDPTFILMWDRNRSMQQHGNMKAMKNPKMQNQKNMQPGIHVFPQPATGTVTVKITGVKDKMVTAAVYDAKGKQVKDLFHTTSTIPVLSFSFDVSDWENGIYTVKSTFDDRNMTMDFKVE